MKIFHKHKWTKWRIFQTINSFHSIYLLKRYCEKCNKEESFEGMMTRDKNDNIKPYKFKN